MPSSAVETHRTTFSRAAGIDISFTQAVYNVEESVGTTDDTVCLQVTGAVFPTQDAVWVSVSSEDNTALGMYY